MAARRGCTRSLVAACAVAVCLVACDGEPSPRATGRTPTASHATETPSPQPSARPRPEREVSLAFPMQPAGERIRFVVSDLRPKLFMQAGPCRLHRFGRVGAYATDCRFAPELAWFHVGLRKEVVEDVRFDRDSFVMIDVHGRRYRPESDLRSSFGPEAPLFPPGGTLDGPPWASGYLVFDRGARALRAASLTYQDRRQNITVVFRGRHTVVAV